MTRLTNVLPFPGAEKSKTYLLLVSPESIPHLCLVHGGLYYSLTYKECESAKDFAPYLQFLVRAKRKLLFVEIDQVAQNPWAVFKKYDKLAGSGLTCLQPIKETIFQKSEANFVFELIQELQTANRIRQVYHMNMEPDFKNQDFFNLREYSKEAIFTYIQTLNEKHAKKR